MKFKKTLVVGIAKSQLDKNFWDKINSLTEKLVLLTPDAPELKQELFQADSLLVCFNNADKEMIDAAPKLKYIGALATGVGKIDKDYAATKNIVVTNIPGYSTESVAELVFAVLLENLRDIARAKKESSEGNRSELGFSGIEIRGKNFGVLGLGRIGARVADLANSFGAKVSYWSKNRKKKSENKGIKFKDINDVLVDSDILSVHFSLNNNTEKIINKDRINLIKNKAIVINTAPLELFDINALLTKVKKGGITFIFDHTDLGDISAETLKQFQNCKNCITYPAIGYVSMEARANKQDIFIKNMESFLAGKPINTVV